MRLLHLLHLLIATHGAHALRNEAVDADSYDVELIRNDVPVNLTARLAVTPSAILGKLAQDLILSTAASVFAGAFLNSLGGASSVVDLSEESIERIADLVRKSIEDAWYARDKADGRTFLQIASNYDRRGTYNLTNPDPTQFGIIDQDRELADEYANIAQGLLNRISLYGLKGAPLYQVIVGTWVSFRKEQIVLSQILDDINHGSTTLAATARASFRADCKAMRNDLIDYRDEYDHNIPPLYFNIKESSQVVSSHLISCRQTVERWVTLRAYKQAQYSDADRASVTVRDWDLDYFRISDQCRMNKCHPSSAGSACIQKWRDWAKQLRITSLESWRLKKRGDFLTNHIDRNIDSLNSLHNGTLPV